MTPLLARTTLGLAAGRATLRSPVVLVPTMGALHDGHRALLRQARVVAGPGGSVAVSIFVNPLQFGAGEDLDRYPRPLADDIEICAQEHADLVFAPAAEQMYPASQQVTVRAGAAGRVLEGRSRPGFLDGVLTVVLKLLHLVGPDVMMFGEKDAQQLAMVRTMVSDLNVTVRIESIATVRDPDGMAASSRNVYLSAAERDTALALPSAMLAGQAAQAEGPAAALDAARAELARGERADPPLKTDYLVLADPVTFAEVGPDFAGQALLLVAATVGTTRLIDNAPLSFATPPLAGQHPRPPGRGEGSPP